MAQGDLLQEEFNQHVDKSASGERERDPPVGEHRTCLSEIISTATIAITTPEAT
jgi:hypothetical protein